MSDTNQTADSVRAEATQEREKNGRFAYGNAGGPGNPFARRVAELRGAIYRVVNEPDIEEIFKALMTKAKEGNVQAARIVLSYSLGRPLVGADPDHADLHEWEIQKRTAPMYQESAQVSRAPSPELPLDITRMMRPVMAEIQARQFQEMLKKETPRERRERRRKEREARRRQQSAKTAPGAAGAPLTNGVFDSGSLRVGPTGSEA